MATLAAQKSTTLTPESSAWAGRAGALVVGSLFVALCSHISVPLPWTPVPMTLQPFAVMLVGLLFGPQLGAATLAAYLLEGAAGLPVFTPQGGAGLAHLLGPTGGYLLSYPAAAALAGRVFRSSPMRTLGHALGGALAAEVVILAGGSAWLGTLRHLAPSILLHATVLPFLGGDMVKVLLAALLAAGWARTRFHRP